MKTTPPSAARNSTAARAAHWEHFPHEADMGVCGLGPTREQTFEQAAPTMTAMICAPAKVVAREPVEIHGHAPDDELLVDWLNAIVYDMPTRRMLFSRLAVKIDGTRLTATAWGEPMDVARHQPAVAVKSATYTALQVAQENGRWVAQTVVDVQGAPRAPQCHYRCAGRTLPTASGYGPARFIRHDATRWKIAPRGAMRVPAKKVARVEPLICIKG